jgi:DNA-binding winged helix-turn-helix (wHTH) protein/Flp pilus assembly protein TadD
VPETVLRFGPFELDVETCELRRAGRKVHLPLQPARVLCLLARRQGHLVTREEIREHLWGNDTFVDADLGLNYCVNAIRSALHDSPRAPHYVETLPRRGYRFIAAGVEAVGRSPGPSGTRRSHRVRPEAHAALLRAQQSFEQEGFVARRTLPAAERLLEEATRLDPEFAEAWGELAANRAWQAWFGLRPYAELLPRAREAAHCALALSENVVKAWAALGVISLYFDWEFETARHLLERAVSLGPRDASVRHAYSDYFVVMGRTQESLDQVRLARELNPDSLLARQCLPGHLVAARRYQEAIDEARGLLASYPDVNNARHFLAKALWMTGRYEEAIADFGRLWGPESEQARVLDGTFRHAGPRAAMRAVADCLAGQAETPALNATEVAACYATCGESDAAFAWLEKAFARRAPGLLHVPVDPFFDPIRSDPRIDDLCRRVGLPIEAWRGPAGSFAPAVEPG